MQEVDFVATIQLPQYSHFPSALIKISAGVFDTMIRKSTVTRPNVVMLSYRQVSVAFPGAAAGNKNINTL
jgi:hypothetical protein